MLIVNFVLGNATPDVQQTIASDINKNGEINKLDIVGIVVLILQ